MAANSPQPEPVAWTPPSYYAHVDPVTGETRLVDSSGTLITSPPPFKRIVNGDVRFEDPWGNDIAIYEPPTTGVHVWVDADGTARVVDDHGYEVPSPPEVVRDGDGEWIVKAADGSAVAVPTYVRPTRNLFVHVDADGTPSVVDGYGNPVPSPPHVYRDGNDPTWRVMGTEDTIDTYRQPETEMFVYTNADGTPSIVDADGIAVPSPPIVWRDGADPTWRIQGGGGEIPPYVPPPTHFLVHENPDGTYQVVDERGDLIASPPQVWREPLGEGFVFAGPGGQPVHVLPYQPPTTGIYIHESPDGTYQVVDANGNLVPSPPAIYHDHESGTYAVAGADGPGPQIPSLWPPAGEPPETWPPVVDEEPPPTAAKDDEAELGDVSEDGAASDPTEAVPPDRPEVEPADAARTPAPEGAEVEEVGALDARAADSEHEASAIGLEADELGALASTDEVSATPIPLPEPPPPPSGEELTEVAALSEDGIQTMPVATPIPSGDEVSATPITLPGTATQAADEVSATPIPLPEPPPPPSGEELTEVAALSEDGIQTMPVATPIPSGDEVSATPITLPGTATQAVDEVAAEAAIAVLPVPVPEPAVEEPDWGDQSGADEIEVYEPLLVEETADDELAD